MLFELFYRGGIPFMTVLTLILLAMLLAAWKAPAWVKEIGVIALVVGVISFLIGFFVAASSMMQAGNVPQSVVWGGFMVAAIPPTYGLFIYLVSLVIRIIQKPRI